jgi:hypothetical protein
LEWGSRTSVAKSNSPRTAPAHARPAATHFCCPMGVLASAAASRAAFSMSTTTLGVRLEHVHLDLSRGIGSGSEVLVAAWR